jgi:hypothetical protein
VPDTESKTFPPDFLHALKTLVNMHHVIYRNVPPQGIYFEALVLEAFTQIKKPFTPIEPTARNLPAHDLLVEGTRIPIKTETGAGTKDSLITITKLCTTEKEPWTPEVLIRRVMDHLRRYDVILMLRAVWEHPLIHYQVLEIPVGLLALIETANPRGSGKRKGRQSLGADVLRNGEKVFRVHFDGSDGKCSVRGVQVQDCRMLSSWDYRVREA